MRVHSHDHFQVIHVLGGCLEVEAGTGWRALEADSVHVLPPGARHALRSATGYSQFGLELTAEPDERGILAALLRAFPKAAVVHMPFRDVWRSVLRRQRSWGKRENDVFRVVHALDDYGISLLETQDCLMPDPRVEKLLEFLRMHLAENVNITAMAAHIHVSRATLQRLCRCQLQHSAARVHERLRLEQAADNLLRSEMSVTECGLAAGYRDIYHFSRVFKRVFGCSPRGYRLRKHADFS